MHLSARAWRELQRRLTDDCHHSKCHYPGPCLHSKQKYTYKREKVGSNINMFIVT